MINIIKCFLKINKNSTSKFAFVKSTLYIFNKGDDSMSSREIFTKTKLFALDYLIIFKKSNDSIIYKFLNAFVQVGSKKYWSIIRHNQFLDFFMNLDNFGRF